VMLMMRETRLGKDKGGTVEAKVLMKRVQL